jgi:hypothetical protein
LLCAHFLLPLNLVNFRHPLAGGHNDLANSARLRRSCNAQDRQAPEQVEPLREVVVDMLLVDLARLRGYVLVALCRMLAHDFLP